MIGSAALGSAVLSRLLAHPRAADLLLRRLADPALDGHDLAAVRPLRTFLLKMGAGALPREAWPAMAKMVGASGELYGKTARAHARGEPVVWVTWPVPAAVVAAFPGVLAHTPETFFAMANAAEPDGSTRMCEVADRHGVPGEICSINRCVLGAFLDGQLPTPTMVVTGNTPCDGNHSGNTVLRELAGADHFSVSGSYDRTAGSVALWARSVWELIAYLEARLHRSLDWGLLRQHARNLNRVNRALNRVTELHRATPAPGVLNPLALYWHMVIAYGWEPAIAEGAELLADAAQHLVERARRTNAPRERLRVVLGDQAMAWTDFAGWLHHEYGGTIVCDYLGHFEHPPIDLSTRESLIEGLVHDRLLTSMVRQAHGTMELTLDELSTALKEYDADCVIFHGNVGCKHNLALRREIDEVCRAARVPACFLDADIIDRRVVDEGPLRRKIAAFLSAEGLPRGTNARAVPLRERLSALAGRVRRGRSDDTRAGGDGPPDLSEAS
jgi:benzoyl-CoA reductase/2-hydroxyglutaryl-CoA dehydratase subunit BcrC/BadD/HgdB